MHSDAKAVTESVREIVAVSRLGNDLPSNGIGVFAGHSGFDSIQGCDKRIKDDIVDILQLLRRFAQPGRPSHIAVVAVELSTHIYDDRLAWLEYSIGWTVMGTRSVWS